MKPIVVLGSGLAGYSVIRELRKLDRDIPVTLVSRDSGDYYSSPCSPMPMRKVRMPPGWC